MVETKNLATKTYAIAGNWLFWNRVYEALKEHSYNFALGNKVSEVKKQLHDRIITVADTEHFKPKTLAAQFTSTDISEIVAALTAAYHDWDAKFHEACNYANACESARTTIFQQLKDVATIEAFHAGLKATS